MRRAPLLLAVLLFAVSGCGAKGDTFSPAKDTLYTSTRYVRGLAVAPDGSIWAATKGGVLHRGPDGKWTKYTQMDGLPSCEAIALSIEGSRVKVMFPRADAVWDAGKWTHKPAKHTEYEEPTTTELVFKGRKYYVRQIALVQESGQWHHLWIPKANHSLVWALLVKDDRLWAATKENGIWTFDGKEWKQADIGFPKDALHTTTMLADKNGTVWLGTRDNGIWSYDGKSWQHHVQPDEPVSAECVSMAVHDGKLYVATLNDGLIARSSAGWESIKMLKDESGYPRYFPKSMSVFNGGLYVMQGDGTVDKFDGRQWDSDVVSFVERYQISALASDASHLYVGQWGGWSEFDGKTWSSRLRNPSMQGHQVTCLLSDENKLWVGLQGLGLAEVDENSGDITWHDERKGLRDDWVTCLCKVGDILYAGTFDGGLALWDGKKWTTRSEFAKKRVNDIVADGKGGILIASIDGVWQLADGKLDRFITRKPEPDLEAASLCRTDDGLWVGTRTGIYFAAGKP